MPAKPKLKIDAQDFLLHTIRLDNRELGAYVRLLMNALIDDNQLHEGDLGRLAGPGFDEIAPRLAPLFKVQKGVWSSHLVAAQHKLSTIRSQAAKSKADKPEKIKQDDKLPSCPHQEIIELFHKHMPMCPRVNLLTEERKRRLRTIWRQDENFRDLKFWRAFFIHCSTVSWMRGDKEGFSPVTFDTLIRASKFPKYVDEAVAAWNLERGRRTAK